MENCKELFLDDVVSFSVHPMQGGSLPIPFSVQGILMMENVELPPSVLTAGYSDTPIEAVEKTILVKCTPSTRESGAIYDMDISASVLGEASNLMNIYNIIRNHDFLLLMRKSNGGIYLAYTLPHSSKMSVPVSIQGTETCQLSFSVKSNSYFIPITLQ